MDNEIRQQYIEYAYKFLEKKPLYINNNLKEIVLIKKDYFPIFSIRKKKSINDEDLLVITFSTQGGDAFMTVSNREEKELHDLFNKTFNELKGK